MSRSGDTSYSDEKRKKKNPTPTLFCWSWIRSKFSDFFSALTAYMESSLVTLQLPTSLGWKFVALQ